LAPTQGKRKNKMLQTEKKFLEINKTEVSVNRKKNRKIKISHMTNVGTKKKI